MRRRSASRRPKRAAATRAGEQAQEAVARAELAEKDRAAELARAQNVEQERGRALEQVRQAELERHAAEQAATRGTSSRKPQR